MKKLPLLAIFIFLAVGIILNPHLSMEAAKQSIVLCTTVIIPSLFPFAFCAIALVFCAGKFLGSLLAPLVSPLFRISGVGALPIILGALGGYPMGAKLTGELYSQGELTKAEAQHLLAFCNNAGPMFVMGAVGAGILKSVQMGRILYLTHILAALTLAFLMRFFIKKAPSDNYLENIKKEWNNLKKAPSLTDILSKATKGAAFSMVMVCANIIIFSVALSLLHTIDFVNIIPKAMFDGFFEISAGVSIIKPSELVICSIILAWSSISVHAQVWGVLSGTGLDMKMYYIGKILCATIAAIYTYLVMLIPQTAAVWKPFGASVPSEVTIKTFFFAICIGIFFGVLVLKAFGEMQKKFN